MPVGHSKLSLVCLSSFLSAAHFSTKVSQPWVMCISPPPLELCVTAMTSGEDYYLTLIAY